MVFQQLSPFLVNAGAAVRDLERSVLVLQEHQCCQLFHGGRGGWRGGGGGRTRWCQCRGRSHHGAGAGAGANGGGGDGVVVRVRVSDTVLCRV